MNLSGWLLVVSKKKYVCIDDQNISFGWLVGWLVVFYGTSTFVGYLTPNPFL